LKSVAKLPHSIFSIAWYYLSVILSRRAVGNLSEVVIGSTEK